MPDKVQVHCPQCHATYLFASDQLVRSAGRSVTCKKCQTTFPLPKPALAEAVAGAGAAALGADAPVAASVPVTAPAAEIPVAAPPANTPPPPIADSATPGIAPGAIPQLSAARTLDYVTGKSADALHFEGSFTPKVELLPGERVLEIFEAGTLDLGLVGRILGYKRRLILTTHRAFRFEKRIIFTTLDMLWLRNVSFAAIGQSIKPGAIVAAIVLGAAGISIAATMVGLLIAPIFFALALLVLWLSRIKVLMASTGNERVGLKLTRLKPEESKRFIDALSRQLQEINGG